MNTELLNQRQSILRTYVNDMIALEEDFAQAVKGQLASEEVQRDPNVADLLHGLAGACEIRKEALERVSKELNGELGATLKEAAAAAAGTLAGLYGKLRKHPVSKMLRDDVTALNLAATSYGMLYTTAVAFHEDEVAETALENLNQLPAEIMDITTQLPGIVVSELAQEDAELNPEAAELASEAIEDAWVNGELALPA